MLAGVKRVTHGFTRNAGFFADQSTPDGMLHTTRKNPIGVAVAGVAATAVLLRAFKQMCDRAHLRQLRCGFREASGDA
jgi:hypothetical protein